MPCDSKAKQIFTKCFLIYILGHSLSYSQMCCIFMSILLMEMEMQE